MLQNKIFISHSILSENVYDEANRLPLAMYEKGPEDMKRTEDGGAAIVFETSQPQQQLLDNLTGRDEFQIPDESSSNEVPLEMEIVTDAKFPVYNL